MSLILKSNVTATKSLGNISGIKTTQDWAAFLDFEGGVYKTKKFNKSQNIALSDAVFSTRANLAGNPVTFNRDGSYETVSSLDEIRMGKTASGRYGIFSEDAATNFFLNSSTPSTQEIAIPPSGNSIGIWCEGTGSLTVTGSNITGMPTEGLVITENSPVLLRPLDAHTNTVLNIIVSGSLKHVQVEQCSGSNTLSSKITTGSTRILRTREQVGIAESFLSNLLTSSSKFTVAIQTVDFLPLFLNIPRRLFASNQLNLHATEDSQIVSTRVGIDYNTNEYYATGFFSLGYTTPTSINTEEVPLKTYAFDKVDLSNTVVMAVDGTKVSSYVNGVKLQDMDSSSPFALSRVFFGTGYSSPVAREGLRGIVTKAVIYDKVLNDEELLELSKSWKN